MHEAITFPRFSSSEYAFRLQRRFGFEVIGRGDGHTFDATLVLAKPSGNVVVKVGTFPAGDPWPLYGAYCLQQAPLHTRVLPEALGQQQRATHRVQ
jgi:hypothetical protein